MAVAESLSSPGSEIKETTPGLGIKGIHPD